MNFLAIDFETANAKRHSACSVALVMVKNNKIVGEYYSLINPHTEFFYRNIQVHGIEPDDVVDAPDFPEVWEQIKQYFNENILITAHNAAFDNSVLKACLTHYGLDVPHFQSLCTVKSSKKLFPEFDSHKLNVVCHELGIDLEHHHDALEDSRACAEILIYQAEHFGVEPLKPLVTMQ